MIKMKKYFVCCLCAVMACGLTACGDKKKGVRDAAEYQTMVVSKKDMMLTQPYSARLTGRQIVEIRPQVTGNITRILTAEGKTVRKGQTLFIIDQTPFQAALEVAIANRQSAEAKLSTAKMNYDSQLKLKEGSVVSDFSVETTRHELLEAQAALVQAQAQEKNAKASLSRAAAEKQAAKATEEAAKANAQLTDSLYELTHNELENALHSVNKEVEQLQAKGADAKLLDEYKLAKQAKVYEDFQRNVVDSTQAVYRTDLQNQLANIDREAAAYRQKGLDEVSATEWAEASKAKVREQWENEISSKINSVWKTELQNRLDDIEREKQAWIQKGLDEVKATQWAEKEKLDAKRNAALQVLQAQKEEFKAYLEGGQRGLAEYYKQAHGFTMEDLQITPEQLSGFQQARKSMYFASAMVAMVSSVFLPSTCRRSRMRSVKLSMSSGDAEMPASLLEGYSQSMSMPSRPYSSTAFLQSRAKPMRQRASAAISLKLPAVHPPMERIIFSFGFCSLSFITFRRKSVF